MNTLKLEDYYDLNIAKYMYELKPLKLRKTLIINHDIHSHNTRNMLNPHIMKRTINITCKNIRFMARKNLVLTEMQFKINAFLHQEIEIYIYEQILRT